MSTTSVAFTAVGAGAHHSATDGKKITYKVSGTFVGTWVFEYSDTGGSTWNEIDSGTGVKAETKVPVEPGQYAQRWYRFRCSAFTSGTITTLIETLEDKSLLGPAPSSPFPSSSHFNVKDYGAIGDDVADDTLQIQAAYDAAIAAGGGVVFYPPGTYRVTDTISISGAPIKALGSGRGISVIKFVNETASAELFDHLSQHFWAYEALTLQAVSSTSVEGIAVNHATYTTVDRMTVRDCEILGFHIGVNVNLRTKFWMSDCYLTARDAANSKYVDQSSAVAGAGLHLVNVVGEVPAATTNAGGVRGGQNGYMFLDHCDIQQGSTLGNMSERWLTACRIRNLANVIFVQGKGYFVDCLFDGAPISGTLANVFDFNDGDEGVIMGCTFPSTTGKTARSDRARHRFIGNVNFSMEEYGAADKNMYHDNQGFEASTIIGPFSKVNGAYQRAGVPGVGDDINDGVQIGDRWIDLTGDDEYVCMDNAVGAAVWKQTNP